MNTLQNAVSLVINLILLGVCMVFAWFMMNRGEGWRGYSVQEMTINKEVKKLLVADTPEKHLKGLSGIYNLKDYDGMLFTFDDPGDKTFYNKDTHLNLTLYWYRSHALIGTSVLPSIDQSGKLITIDSPGTVDTVVELVNRDGVSE